MTVRPYFSQLAMLRTVLRLSQALLASIRNLLGGNRSAFRW